MLQEKKKVRIFQVLPTLAKGDGVGNEVLAIDNILKELGYQTRIYAENVLGWSFRTLADSVNNMPELDKEDIVIYHLSTGTELNRKLNYLQCKILIIYHNITPPSFFEAYNQKAVELSTLGIQGVRDLQKCADYCLADSEYNKQELIQYGYECKIDVVPIIVPFEKYEKRPNMKIVQRFKDDYVNIIFVGRISPNKKQEDIIKTYYYYKKYINKKSRLFLVGSYNGMERYKERLEIYVQSLEVEDVFFTGHIKFEDLVAYYHIADVFLCMSEHEGFCIPLLEAMYFQVPIIAYEFSGVKDTLAGSGLRMTEKNCKVAAEMISLIIENRHLREKVLEEQNLRLNQFSYKNTREKFVEYLEGFLQNR